MMTMLALTMGGALAFYVLIALAVRLISRRGAPER
jgi:hypothetical protein